MIPRTRDAGSGPGCGGSLGTPTTSARSSCGGGVFVFALPSFSASLLFTFVGPAAIAVLILFAGKLAKDIDLRDHGSGNTGATNFFRVLGGKLGALAALVDIAKGYLAVALVAHISLFSASALPSSASLIAATLAAVTSFALPFIYLLTRLIFGLPTLGVRKKLALYFKGEAELFYKAMVFGPRNEGKIR
jgi:hypothetical protein